MWPDLTLCIPALHPAKIILPKNWVDSPIIWVIIPKLWVEYGNNERGDFRAASHGLIRQRVRLSDVASLVDTSADDLLALDDALKRLAEIDPPKADLVKLRYFAGLSEQQAADALGISRSTASRYWTFSRAWLIHEIEGDS